MRWCSDISAFWLRSRRPPSAVCRLREGAFVSSGAQLARREQMQPLLLELVGRHFAVHRAHREVGEGRLQLHQFAMDLQPLLDGFGLLPHGWNHMAAATRSNTTRKRSSRRFAPTAAPPSKLDNLSMS